LYVKLDYVMLALSLELY